MNSALIFSLYPLLYLPLGNFTRLFFLPFLILLLIKQIIKNKLLINKRLFYTISIFIFYNIFLTVINSGSYTKLSLHIIQLLIVLFFAGCSKDFAYRFVKSLRYPVYFIILIVYILFTLKLLGVDIYNILLLSRYTEYKYFLANVSDHQMYIFERGILERISFGNPTNMVVIIFTVLLMQGTNRKDSLIMTIMFLPITLISASRTFFTSISIYLLSQIKIFKKINIFSSILYLYILFIFIFSFILLSVNTLDIFSNFLRIDINDPVNLLLRESRRITYYFEVLDNIRQFTFSGGGIGYSYKFIEQFTGERTSTESLYLGSILDYGLIPTILLFFSFVKSALQSGYISITSLFIILITGFTIPYLDADLSYILIGLILNPRLSNKNNSINQSNIVN